MKQGTLQRIVCRWAGLDGTLRAYHDWARRDGNSHVSRFRQHVWRLVWWGVWGSMGILGGFGMKCARKLIVEERFVTHLERLHQPRSRQ